MANRWGNNGNSDRLYFLGLQKSLQMVTAAMKLKDTCSLEEKLWKTRRWKSLSCVWLFATPWTIQSVEFSRPEYWSGSLSFLQRIFPTQRLNTGLPHCTWILYQLSHKGLHIRSIRSSRTLNLLTIVKFLCLEIKQQPALKSIEKIVQEIATIM